MFETLKAEFISNFLVENRWLLLLKGLVITLKITFFAVLLGLVLGFSIAVVRNVYDNTKKLKILNLEICFFVVFFC